MRLSWFVCSSLMLLAPAAAPAAESTARDMVLWYRQPGVQWLDAHAHRQRDHGSDGLRRRPAGADRAERVQLLVRPAPRLRRSQRGQVLRPDSRSGLRRPFQEAEKLADAHFYGRPSGQQAYQPLGDLLLSFDDAQAVEDYRRELDMETGVAQVRYRVGDAVFTREVFLSYPDRVMVVRITADKPGRDLGAGAIQEPLSGPCDSPARRPGHGRMLERPDEAGELADCDRRRQGDAVPDGAAGLR